ncbi:hypothetical protein QBC40DRAFT_321860 [Triangularia verruculosa]|uniref:Rhodopsin domain-containing protein n=1 Tax=Triangularia verruculosa TaxID=2587418 RepID=A0AAN6XL25_9PEZI|nr:hypothetical protein QBC40DRAFT_321860 [Triangularia verruculosa]
MATTTNSSLPPDENRGPEILAICGTLVALSVAIVSLRIWVRARMIGHVGADDWTIIAATTVIFVEMMIIIPQVHYGAGRHVQYIKPASNITKGLHLNFVTQPLCLISLCLTKVSVGFFLLRLTPSKRFQRFVIGMIIFTVLSATGNFLTVFFQCQPLAFTWGGVAEGKCMPPENLKFAAFFNSSVAVLTDVIFALLPVPMLWKVQLNWKVKSAVAAILSLGLFAAVAAIVKITFLSSYGKHGDFLWDSTDLTIWTTIEICTAIIAASSPCLKPLFKTLFDGSSARAGAYGSSYKGYVRDTDAGTNNLKSGNRNTLRSKGTVTITAGGDENEFELYSGKRCASEAKSGNISSTPMGSEESILHGTIRGDGITKTTSVFVSSIRNEGTGNNNHDI